MEEKEEVVLAELSGWSYDSSRPSCGVGSTVSLYFPIQLRLRGASGRAAIARAARAACEVDVCVCGGREREEGRVIVRISSPRRRDRAERTTAGTESGCERAARGSVLAVCDGGGGRCERERRRELAGAVLALSSGRVASSRGPKEGVPSQREAAAHYADAHSHHRQQQRRTAENTHIVAHIQRRNASPTIKRP